MPPEVFNRVLAFAERISGRWTKDARAALFGVLVVRVHVLYANHHCTKARLVAPFGTNNSAIPHVHLDSVVPDGDSNCEPESIA